MRLDELPETLALLQRISDQLAELPRAIALAQHAGSSLSRADREQLATLLPVIATALRGYVFATRDLFTEASRNDALGTVLIACLGELDANAAKRLGKLLARADGVCIGDLRVDSVRKARDGVVWVVRRV